MALLDVLDAVNIPEDEALRSFEEALATQSTEVPEETKPTTTTEKPEDKPKTTQKTPTIQDEYTQSKPTTPDTKGMVQTGVTTSNASTYNESKTQGESVSQGTSDNVQYKVEPDISMEDWKKKYQYKDWSEFSKEMGYNPPSEKDLAERQKTQRQVAWIKGLGGVANEFAKMIGVSAGGDAAKQEYKIDEVDQYAKEKEDYLKKLEEYKTKGMSYELGLRDKYAQYMQNMAKTISSGRTSSQTQQEGTSEQRGESVGANQTWQDKGSVNARNAANWAAARKTTEEKKPESYPFSRGVFTIYTNQTKDKAVVNRAYQSLQGNKGVFSQDQQKELNIITPKISPSNPNRKEEEASNQYRYVVAATQMLLDDAYNLRDKIEEAIASDDPLQQYKLPQLQQQLKQKEQAINALQDTGIDFQLYSK